MPRDEDDDLYDDDYDFVDDDVDDEEADEAANDVGEESEPADEAVEEPRHRGSGGRRTRGPRRAEPRGERRPDSRGERRPQPQDERRDEDFPEGESDADAEQVDQVEEPVDEYGRPAPAANYVVHIYEHRKFKRTIDRPFTPEEAEAFATEYNRTSKPYHRMAVAGKNDAQPKKTLE